MKDALGYVETQIIHELKTLLTEDMAKMIARSITTKVREQWGGDKPYIAKESTRQLRERNRSIISDWREQRKCGYDDRSKLARQYKLHPTTINRVIAKYVNRKNPQSVEDWEF